MSSKKSLENAGEAGVLISKFDWSKNSLGPFEKWPQSLKTAVGIMLKSRIPMFLTWGKDRIFLYNDAYAPILGEKHPQALGRTFYENWKEIWTDISPLIDRIDRGESVYFEDLPLLMHRHKENKLEETFFTFSYSPIFDESDKVGGLFCACVETTHRIKAEKELKAEQVRLESATVQSEREREKFETAFNAVAEGIFIFDSEGQPVFMNEGAAKVFGAISAAEVTKDFAYYFERLDLYEMDGTFIPLEEWPVSKVLRGESFRDWQIRAHRRDINRRWIWSSSGELAIQKGSDKTLAVVILRDITEQKETEIKAKEDEVALIKAVKSRDEFLSIASHELKTPLTSLKLQTQIHKRLIKLDDPIAFSKERVTETVEQTEKQIIRITRLVDDMFDVSRIRTGVLQIKREPFNLSELVVEVITRLENQFLNAGYKVPNFKTVPDAEGNWDKLRIEQVLINLFTNAIRYGNKMAISVKLESNDKTMKLSVTDKGIGISLTAQEKIFDRFERAVSANDVSGLGLGLFITKQIVLSHGGKIWVDSELGKGATFNVELPREMNC